jgi:Polysaccharide lyase
MRVRLVMAGLLVLALSGQAEAAPAPQASTYSCTNIQIAELIGTSISGTADCISTGSTTTRHMAINGNARFEACSGGHPGRSFGVTGTLTASGGGATFSAGYTIDKQTAYSNPPGSEQQDRFGQAVIYLDSGQSGEVDWSAHYGANTGFLFHPTDICTYETSENPLEGIAVTNGSFAPAERTDPPLWAADAESPLTNEWASTACQDPASETARVTSPLAQGRAAYRLEVRDGDDYFGERCELGQANPRRPGFPLFKEGDERWISWQVYLPTNFPVSATRFQVVAQWKQMGSLGTPALAMAVNNGKFSLDSSDSYVSGNAAVIARRVGTAQVARWVKFTLHVKFSPDPNVGFIELFGDLDGNGQTLLLPLTHIWTMKRDETGSTVDSHARIGIYRDPLIQGASSIYYDGYTVATSKELAEANAYRSPLPG